jgi:serine/threonine-protein kinase
MRDEPGGAANGKAVSATAVTVIERPAQLRIAASSPGDPTIPDARTDTPQTPSVLEAPALPGGRNTNTIASPAEALARDELLRTRNYAYMALGIASGVLPAVAILPGGYLETRILIAALFVAICAMLYLLYRTRDPATFYRGPGVSIAWFVAAVAVSSAVPYFGPNSPFPVVLVMGIYFVGLGQSRALAVAVYGQCAIVQGVSSALAIAGVADPGIVRADYLSVEAQLIVQGLVQMILASSFFISRASRRSSLAALGELQDAVRDVAQREALLQEAREELRRAFGTGRGRFSDQTISHYRLGELLGRGAMGEVYEGVDTRNDQPVAVKMLAHASLGNADHVTRFVRELDTTAAIESPNVVRVLDVGMEPLPHLVMERLRGRDLRSILRDKRVLAPNAALEILTQVGIGITAAGKAGVIHRDLKPQNVFLAGTTWKILDFGVSRLAESSDTLTAGQLVGTPAYMAPEQARGARLDHRTDLYALAAIAYRCLTGHAPFAGGELAEVLYCVVHTAPPRPSSLARLPTDLDLALAIGLAKQPADRFATADDLVCAISDALQQRLPETLRERATALDAAGAWKS